MLHFNSELNEIFDQFSAKSIEGGTLSDREKVISIYIAGLLTKSNATIKNAMMQAKQLGVTNEELGQLNAIAIVVNATSLKPELNTSSSNSDDLSSCCQ